MQIKLAAYVQCYFCEKEDLCKISLGEQPTQILELPKYWKTFYFKVKENDKKFSVFVEQQKDKIIGTDCVLCRSCSSLNDFNNLEREFPNKWFK